MTDSLKLKTLSGIMWATVERFGTTGIHFVVSILIARVLSPKDYGVVGVIMIFIALSQTFVDSGFGSAIIQSKNISKIDTSSVFYFNIFFSLLLYIILFFTAPEIELFFKMPSLATYIRVAGLVLIINALSLVQNFTLRKEINFKAISKASVSGVFVSGVVGIWMAYAEFGVWALIAQILVKAIVMTLLLWILGNWTPMFAFSFNSIKRLFSYSSKLLASSLLETAMQKLTNFIIGKWYTPVELGFFTQGKLVQQVPVSTITAVVQTVTFPVLTIIQDDKQRLKDNYRRIIKMTIYFVFPVVFFIVAAANPIILILLTEKWAPTIPIIQVLAVGTALYPIHAITLNISKVVGRTDVFFKLEIIKKVIGIAVLLSAIPFGVMAIVAAETILSFIFYWFNGHFNGKLIDYKVSEQLKDIVPIYFSAVIMAIVVYIAGLFFKNIYLSIIVQMVVAVVIYGGLSLTLMKEQLVETKEILNIYLSKLRGKDV